MLAKIESLYLGFVFAILCALTACQSDSALKEKLIIDRLPNSVYSTNYPFYTSDNPFYIDNSSAACPKLYYSTKKVIQNCSSLNLAANASALNTDYFFVTILILSKNNFQSRLPVNALNLYSTLETLDLSANYLSESSTDLQLIDCNIVQELKELVLKSNLFTQIPLLSLTCMNKLERLQLSYNPLLVNVDNMNTFGNAITTNTTKYMPNLKYLDLSHCNIQTINKANFTVLSYFANLVYLNLIGNRIKFIYYNPFVWVPYLNYLSFEQNLLFCDSYIAWMKQFLNAKRGRLSCLECTAPPPPVIPPAILGINLDGSLNNTAYKPSCFSPLTLNNQSIVDLDDLLFITYIMLTTSIQNTNITVQPGATIVLDCELFSQPASDLWWTFDKRYLSKIVSPNSSYTFIENFSPASNQNLNKKSMLQIKNTNTALTGEYSCASFYLGYEPNVYINITSLMFYVTFLPSQNVIVTGQLTAAEIAGIVIGCILGFLLLCLLVFLCVFCCCFRGACCCFGGACCCFSGRDNEKKKTYLSEGINRSSDSSNIKRQVTESEENASGFRDLNRIKPNYVINTINKSTSSLAKIDTEQDPTISWRILPNKNLVNTKVSNINNQATSINIIHSNQSPAEQDLIDINVPYDETTIYNVHNPLSYNGKYSISKRQQSQIYSINNPIDYGSNYNTNECFLNDNSEINQNLVQFSSETHDREEFENYDSFDPNNVQHFTSTSYGNQHVLNAASPVNGNLTSFSKKIVTSESETIRNKQYIYSNGTNANYVHEINNTSFAKYDSDV